MVAPENDHEKQSILETDTIVGFR